MIVIFSIIIIPVCREVLSVIKTRFAPSPTGHLHIGGARTGLFNWLYARHHHGVFVLRIEDTDIERSKDEFVEGILGGLRWLGIDWDEGPFYQKDNMEMYRAHALKLLEKGLAYRCYCSPAELEEKREKALKEGRKPVYDRTCRDGTDGREGPFVIRFKNPLSGEVTFTDLVRGDITFRCEELDDLVILRTDNTPTYNFTVVVDDALMGITHVIRGDDHINNTPRQILIYRALDYPVPFFAHVPLIHGKDKGRLSKRHGATSVLEYRESGFFPEALVNYLSRLGWASGDQEVFSKDELMEKFDLDHVGKSPSVFDMDKLTWLNGHYMKTLPPDTVLERLMPFLPAGAADLYDREALLSMVVNLRERARTLVDMASMASYFFTEDYPCDQAAEAKFLTEETKPILIDFLERLTGLDTLDLESQKAIVDELAGRYEKKLVAIIQPVRVALTGRTVSPGIFEVIEILGRKRVETRLKRAIDSIQ